MGGFPFTAVCRDPSGKVRSLWLCLCIAKLPDICRAPQLIGVALKDNSDGTLSASYTPLRDGVHVVEVLLSAVHVGGANGHAKSPFNVPVSAAVVHATKCKLYGPGLEGGHVGALGKFTVKAFNRFGTPVESNAVQFKLRVTGPPGADPKRQHLVGGKVPGEFEGEYLPIAHGDHTVTVDLNGHPVAQSPVHVNIQRDPNASDPNQSWAEHLNDPTTIEPVRMRIHAGEFSAACFFGKLTIGVFSCVRLFSASRWQAGRPRRRALRCRSGGPQRQRCELQGEVHVRYVMIALLMVVRSFSGGRQRRRHV